MKKLLILALFLWALPAYSQTTVNGRVQTGTNALKPATCAAGDQYNAIDTFQILICGPANTWVASGTSVFGNPGALPAFFNSIKTQPSTMQCSSTYNAGTGQQYCINLMGHTTNANTTAVIWSTALTDGTIDSNMWAFEGDAFSQPTAPTTFLFNGVSFNYSENDGPGTVTDQFGVLAQYGTLNSSTTTNIEGFWGREPFLMPGHGTVHNAYIYRAAPLGVYGDTLNAAYRADDQGTNAKSFAYYSAGGQNRLIKSSGQTLPVLDIVSANATTPYGGAVTIRGDGLGMVPIEGEAALLEIVQHDSNTVGFVLSSGDAPAGNSMDITQAADGHTNWTHSTNGVEFDFFSFNADGSHESHPAAGKAFIAPQYATTTNCQDNAGAAACGSAAAGHFVIDAATTSTVVSTTAVTANSEIHVTRDDSLGTLFGITCNTQSSLVLGTPRVTARTAGTSFTVTIDAGPTTNRMCLGYSIVN